MPRPLFFQPMRFQPITRSFNVFPDTSHYFCFLRGLFPAVKVAAKLTTTMFFFHKAYQYWQYKPNNKEGANFSVHTENGLRFSPSELSGKRWLQFELMIPMLEASISSDPAWVPTMVSLRDILSWGGPQADVTVDDQQENDRVKYYILEHCDAEKVPTFACMNGSVRQVASQFNSGESPDRSLTHPKDFKYDHTQGPAEQRTAFLSALARWVYRDRCDSLTPLMKYPEFEGYFDYQYGYLTPRSGCEAKGLSFLRAHLHEIQLNVQPVKIDGSNNKVIQVLNAALALGPYDRYRGDRTEAGNRAIQDMSALLLQEQYKAVTSVAIRQGRANPAMRIPLCFTLVGGGVFLNDEQAIKKAIDEACQLIERSGVKNLDVCLSAYQYGEADTYRTRHFDGAPVIDEVTLSGLERLSDYAPDTEPRMKRT